MPFNAKASTDMWGMGLVQLEHLQNHNNLFVASCLIASREDRVAKAAASSTSAAAQ